MKKKPVNYRGERNQKILDQYYLMLENQEKFKGDVDKLKKKSAPLTLEDIGKKFGISKQRVAEIVKEMLDSEND